MVDVTPLTRRDRLRTATLAEIKQVARRLLIEGGPPAISLRAIARDMGMTAPAIYRYFESLDALVFQLTSDLYDEMRVAVEDGRDTVPDADPIGQIVAMARAFRSWALANKAEFGLLYGPPLPGVAAFEDACHDLEHAAARFGAAFVEVLARCPMPAITIPAVAISPDLIPCAEPFLQMHGDLPPEFVYLYLNAWLRLYGLVAMEVFGHIRWGLTDVHPLFETELTMFVLQLTGSPGA